MRSPPAALRAQILDAARASPSLTRTGLRAVRLGRGAALGGGVVCLALAVAGAMAPASGSLAVVSGAAAALACALVLRRATAAPPTAAPGSASPTALPRA